MGMFELWERDEILRQHERQLREEAMSGEAESLRRELQGEPEKVNTGVLARLRDAVAEGADDAELSELVLLAVVAEETPSPIRAHRESLMFHAALREMGAMHDRKQTDYGKDQDPFANVRSSEEWGIPGWVGAMVRANDKVHRLKRFAERGSLANEGVEDSLIDIAVYSIIALCLYREESAAAGAAALVADED